MIFLKRFAFATVLATVSGATVPSYAFMADVSVATVDASTDLTQSVELIRQELQAGKTTCGEMLTKIDAAIEQIDAVLDKGVADETKYLGLRDELVELRLALPCVANKLAAQNIVNGEVMADVAIVEPVVVGDGTMIGEPGLVGPGYGGMSSSGGVASSGGGGGGSGSSGGGSGGLLALGALGAAVALGVTDDDDNPGDNASPSDTEN